MTVSGGLGGALSAAALAGIGRPPPMTLALTGATGAVWMTGAAVIALGATITAARATGCAFTNVARGTTVTAPATL